MTTNYDDPDYDEFADSSVAVLTEQQQAPPSDTWDKWVKRGKKLAKANYDVRFDLGDWINDGDLHVPDLRGIPGLSREQLAKIKAETNHYAIAEEITGLSYFTLKDLASTADRCPESVRTDKLSWSHHRVLINAKKKANEDDLRKWLQRAIDEKMSVAKFKVALTPVKSKVDEKSFLVTVSLDFWHELNDYAAGEDVPVQKYASDLLSDCLNEEAPEARQARRKLSRDKADARTYQKQSKNGKRLQSTHPGKPFGG
jgi:hypothetical protein